MIGTLLLLCVPAQLVETSTIQPEVNFRIANQTSLRRFGFWRQNAILVGRNRGDTTINVTTHVYDLSRNAQYRRVTRNRLPLFYYLRRKRVR